MKNKLLMCLIVIGMIMVNLVCVYGDLNLEIGAEVGSFKESFIAQTDDGASTGYDFGFDAEAPSNPSPGNYTLFHSTVSGKKLIIDCWNSGANPRTIVLKFDTNPSVTSGDLVLSWSMNDDDFDATISSCLTDETCDIRGTAVNMESSSSITDADIDSTPRYFYLSVSDQEDEGDAGSGGGGGGGGGGTPLLKIDLPGTITIDDPESIKIPITIENTGTQTATGVQLSAVIKAGEVPDYRAEKKFTQSYFDTITKSQTVETILELNISSPQQELYEIEITAESSSPIYSISDSIFINLFGQNAAGANKLILFSEDMINENAECLELKDLVDEAKREFEAGNIKEAISKAQAAIDACRDAVEGAQSPFNFKRREEKILLYLLLSFILAIIFGVLFNIYRIIRFKLRFRKIFKNKMFYKTNKKR